MFKDIYCIQRVLKKKKKSAQVYFTESVVCHPDDTNHAFRNNETSYVRVILFQ